MHKEPGLEVEEYGLADRPDQVLDKGQRGQDDDADQEGGIRRKPVRKDPEWLE